MVYPTGAFGSATDFVDRMAAITDLLRLATFDSCGVEAINMRTTDGQDLALLSRIGEPAVPEELHEPAAIIFGFDDVSLKSYLAQREELTAGREAAYAWNVVIVIPGIVEQYTSQVLAAAEGLHTWCLRNEAKEALSHRLQPSAILMSRSANQ